MKSHFLLLLIPFYSLSFSVILCHSVRFPYLYIRLHLAGDPHPFLFGSPAGMCMYQITLFSNLITLDLLQACVTYPGFLRVPVQSPFRSRPYSRKGSP